MVSSDLTFIQKVLDQFRDGPPTNAGVLLHGAEAIAPGMVTVRCVDGSFDVYFDPERWVPGDPDTWNDLETEPPDLIDTGLHVIEVPDHTARRRLPLRRPRRLRNEQLEKTHLVMQGKSFFIVPDWKRGFPSGLVIGPPPPRIC